MSVGCMSVCQRGEFPVLYKVSREGLFDKMFEQSPIGRQVGKKGHVAIWAKNVSVKGNRVCRASNMGR